MTRDLSVEAMEDEQVALLFAVLQDGTREWRDELGEVSEDAMFWQPVEGSYSIGSVLLHIAAVEVYWLQEVLAGVAWPPEERERLLWDQTEVDAGRWALPPRHNPAWFYEQLDAVRERTKATLRTYRILDLSQPTPRGNVLTLRWILSHVAQHDSYHGGQAVLLHEMYKQKMKQTESVKVE